MEKLILKLGPTISAKLPKLLGRAALGDPTAITELITYGVIGGIVAIACEISGKMKKKD